MRSGYSTNGSAIGGYFLSRQFRSFFLLSLVACLRGTQSPSHIQHPQVASSIFNASPLLRTHNTTQRHLVLFPSNWITPLFELHAAGTQRERTADDRSVPAHSFRHNTSGRTNHFGGCCAANENLLSTPQLSRCRHRLHCFSLPFLVISLGHGSTPMSCCHVCRHSKLSFCTQLIGFPIRLLCHGRLGVR
jgi:hypothetical protein